MGVAAQGVSVLAPIVGQVITSQLSGSSRGSRGKQGGSSGAMASLFEMIIKSNDKKR